MIDDHEAAARGERAKQELGLSERAFAGLRQAALEEIVAAPPEAAAKRERLIVCVQIIDAVRRALQEAVDAGEVANYRLALAEQDLLKI